MIISRIGRKMTGFTLIELLVVISIIALLSSVVLSSLNTARARARDGKRLSDLRQIATALELYASDNGGNYPSTGSLNTVYMDLGCLQAVNAPDLKSQDWVPGLVPNYMRALPVDPKPISGGCYMYSGNGTKYLLTAYATVEGVSNGGKMNSNFGYRELVFMGDPGCLHTTQYPSLDALKRKSFTLTNLNLSTDVPSLCAQLGP